MDYPESDEDCAARTQDLASENAILDTEDMDLGTGSTLVGASWNLDRTNPSTSVPALGTVMGGALIRQAVHSEGTVRRPTSTLHGNNAAVDGPDLPPIYRTVRKDREKGLVTHNLSGGGPNGAGSTMYGASVSQIDLIGSFANAGDKRHNITSHRFDFKNTRNLSTSFDTSTLKCTTCQKVHLVLRREIKDGDVGLDTPPVFVLSDQNFPAMGRGTVPVSRSSSLNTVRWPNW